MKKPILSIFNRFRKGLHSDPKFIYYAYTCWYFVHTISLPYVWDIQGFENNFEECGLYFNIDGSYEIDVNKVNAQD
ncbi:MAG: hypothetical protein JNK69_08070 [Saprospiraceae bacterium]|nr:hypothetical protein [Saprospiraceae bacterium]MCC6844330.1 hypothetical protein [Saprospiraceae bacterium]HRG32621.1 hypothetical protein [Saprospiraceae bacterium]